MGNPPKITKWRVDGDPGISVSGLEERVNDINGCGKTGKNGRMATVTSVTPGRSQLLITW
tara:strand:- start:422 stop:601 length:180 start_codon:yes stop_codon:yes gene_type:complete